MNRRLKILIIVDWFYPGFKAGGPIQSCINLIEAFENEYEFFVLTSDRDLGDYEPYKEIHHNSWNNYKCHAKIFYSENKDITLIKIRNIISSIQPDVIYINGIFSWYFSLLPVIATFGTVRKIIVAPRGMLQKGALDLKSAKKQLYLFLIRFIRVYKHVIFHATDDQEKKDIFAHLPKSKGVFVAPNFPRMQQEEWVEIKKEKGSLLLVFLSRISPKKNLLSVFKWLKNITNSKVKFTIVGEIEDKHYWALCNESIKNLPDNISIEFVEALPNNQLASFYAKQHLFILPTMGENYGHAIVEALICGKPVLISDKTPWKHLKENQVGFNIPISDDLGFREAINKFLIMDQAEYNEWSISAWEFGRTIQKSSEQLKSIYSGIFKSESQ